MSNIKSYIYIFGIHALLFLLGYVFLGQAFPLLIAGAIESGIFSYWVTREQIESKAK